MASASVTRAMSASVSGDRAVGAKVSNSWMRVVRSGGSAASRRAGGRGGRCWCRRGGSSGRGHAGQAVQHGGGRGGLHLAYGDRFGEAAGAVEQAGDLVPADVPLGVGELSEVAAVDLDAA